MICSEVALEPEGHEHHSTGSGTGMVKHHQMINARSETALDKPAFREAF